MASGQNKYATLISNTIIFALGTFGSKLLVFLLMPLYTSYLSTAEYGAMDVVVNVSNMLLPLVIVSINDGVIRFGMDRPTTAGCVLHRHLGVVGGVWGLPAVLPAAGPHRDDQRLHRPDLHLCIRRRAAGGQRPVRPGDGTGAALRLQRHPEHRLQH